MKDRYYEGPIHRQKRLEKSNPIPWQEIGDVFFALVIFGLVVVWPMWVISDNIVGLVKMFMNI